jgi:hypothetical protein
MLVIDGWEDREMNNDDRVLEDSCPICESQLEVVSVKFSIRRGAIAVLACADCRRAQHGSQQDSRLTKRLSPISWVEGGS